MLTLKKIAPIGGLGLLVALGAMLCTTPRSAVQAAGDKAAESKAIRIRAGSTEKFIDHEGNEWLGEEGFEGGDTISRDPDMKIENTKDPALYLSEHYSMDSFSRDVPNGKYKVKLHFAETYEGVTGKGERVFSFNVAGKDFKDFDVFEKAGGVHRAYVETVDADIKDGKLKITFTPQIENPEINGIEIIPVTDK
jgi:malectin (di-glucose binding ER protein)